MLDLADANKMTICDLTRTNGVKTLSKTKPMQQSPNNHYFFLTRTFYIFCFILIIINYQKRKNIACVFLPLVRPATTDNFIPR